MGPDVRFGFERNHLHMWLGSVRLTPGHITMVEAWELFRPISDLIDLAAEKEKVEVDIERGGLLTLKEARKLYEEQYLKQVVQYADAQGLSVKATAKKLGVTRKTYWMKRDEYGLIE